MIYSANLNAYSGLGTALGTGIQWKEDLIKVTKKTPFILFIYYLFMNFYFWLRLVFVAAVRRLSLVGDERELLFVAVRGLLIAAASLVVEHGL